MKPQGRSRSCAADSGTRLYDFPPATRVRGKKDSRAESDFPPRPHKLAIRDNRNQPRPTRPGCSAKPEALRVDWYNLESWPTIGIHFQAKDSNPALKSLHARRRIYRPRVFREF